MPAIRGKVFLVGAGPGDPGLLTVRAMEVLRRADVVVYDRLVHPSILRLVPPGAERIPAPRDASSRASSGEATLRRVEAAARAGKTVVRLKGGDPYVFGRGGEEALRLRRAGIRFETIPGVTAALGAAASAGIPLTHRGVASAVVLVTGHEAAGALEAVIDFVRLGRVPATIVCYMGLGRVDSIARRLREGGLSPTTPAAVVSWATAPEERVVEGTLHTIARRASQAGLDSPGVLVVGEVVSLRAKLRDPGRGRANGIRRGGPSPSRPASAPRVDACFEPA